MVSFALFNLTLLCRIMIYAFVIMYVFYSIGCTMSSTDWSPGTELNILYDPDYLFTSIALEWIYHIISIIFVMNVLTAMDSIPIVFFIQIASRYRCMISLLDLLNTESEKRDHDYDTRVLRAIYYILVLCNSNGTGCLRYEYH